jgi:putative hydrolase of the HAD superfamily
MSLSPEVRAVAFDLDDTFWDCAPAIERAESVLNDWLRREAPEVLARHEAVPMLERRKAALDAEPALAGDVSALRKRMLAELFREANHDHALSEEAYRVFYQARSDVVLYAGVLDLLDALRPQYKVAAITNGNADLAQIGIADRFDIILRATLEVPAKPDVAMFRLALDHFGLAPDSMVHVGDSPTTDVAGAQAAGVPAVWFNQSAQAWSGPAPAPDYTVHSIAQLRTLLLD